LDFWPWGASRAADRLTKWRETAAILGEAWLRLRLESATQALSAIRFEKAEEKVLSWGVVGMLLKVLLGASAAEENIEKLPQILTKRGCRYD